MDDVENTILCYEDIAYSWKTVFVPAINFFAKSCFKTLPLDELGSTRLQLNTAN